MQPNFCRSAATVAACGVGRRRMAGIYAAPGTSESVTLRSTGGQPRPALRMSSLRRSGIDVGDGFVGCVGSGADFNRTERGRETETLEN